MEIELKNKRKVIFNKDNNYIRIIKNDNVDHPVLPSAIYNSGYMSWNKNDKLHRDGKSASIWMDGTKYYWENNVRVVTN